MRIETIGYGAGTRDPAGHPNVLRVLVGEEADQDGWERTAVVECEIDDMNPQIFGVLMERLYAAGAVEVFYTAVQMKKNRPLAFPHTHTWQIRCGSLSLPVS